MFENETTLSNREMVQKKRLDKYLDKVQSKPKMRNQLLIKNGQAIFVRNGKSLGYYKVEGYVKLPGMERSETIDQVNMLVALLPKGQMIIKTDDQIIFRGYRDYNTSDSFLLLHASGEDYDVLVADIAEDIPALVAIDDSEGDNIVNPLSYRIMEHLMRSPVQECNTVDMVEEGDDDEWE